MCSGGTDGAVPVLLPDSEVAPAVVPPVIAPVVDGSALYVKTMTPFAVTCKKSLADVTSALVTSEVIGGPDDDAVEVLTDEDTASKESIVSALRTAGVAPPNARLAIKKLRGLTVPATTASAVVAPAMVAPAEPQQSLLEMLPDDQAILAAFKSGGVLEVQKAQVVVAGRCLLAQQMGVFGADRKLLTLINDYYTTRVKRRNPTIYWELRKAVTRKRYASLFQAMDMPGAGELVTVSAQRKFWARMQESFVPKLVRVQETLTAWYEAWERKASMNVGLVVGNALASAAGGIGAGPGTRIPPINNIVAAVETMIDGINECFAGEFEAVGIALGHDAVRIRNLIDNADLYAHIGAAERREFMELIGIKAGSDVVMMESAFANWLHNALRIPSMPPTGMRTAGTLAEIQELGAALGEEGWAKLTSRISFDPKSAAPGLIGIGAGRKVRNADDVYEDEDDDEEA